MKTDLLDILQGQRRTGRTTLAIQGVLQERNALYVVRTKEEAEELIRLLEPSGYLRGQILSLAEFQCGRSYRGTVIFDHRVYEQELSTLHHYKSLGGRIVALIKKLLGVSENAISCLKQEVEKWRD